jgi:hypothetical protein
LAIICQLKGSLTSFLIMKSNKTIFLLTLICTVAITRVHANRAITVSNDASFELVDKDEGGDFTCKVGSINGVSRIRCNIMSQRDDVKLITSTDGYKQSGVFFMVDSKTKKLVSPKVKIFSYETTYHFEKEKGLLVHTDFTFLSNHAKAPSFDWYTSFELGRYEKGKWGDLSSGATCEIIPTSGFKKTYSLFSDNVPRDILSKKVTIRIKELMAVFDIGSKTVFSNTPHHATDDVSIGVIADSTEKGGRGVREGEKHSIEFLMKIDKNDLGSEAGSKEAAK